MHGSSGNSTASALTAYPNPFTTSVEINFLMQNAKLQIFDISGKQINKSYNVRRTAYVWNAQNRPAGTYIVRVYDGKNTYSKRVLCVK
jgi:hypothetical protein